MPRRVRCRTLAAMLILLCGAAQGQTDQQARKWFQEGLQALHQHQANLAEGRFRQILKLEPPPGREYIVGARVNLGVLAMQRQQWQAALANFEAAERLAPEMTGIRLDIGLSKFYRGTYEEAIPVFRSVLRDQPASEQAHYFLGVCDFMSGRYDEAERMLTPLWQREQDNISYLYVLAVAGSRTGDTKLQQKALAQLLRTGAGRPELDLIRGRAELNRNRLTTAIVSLEKAARLDPRLPYVHFSLGQAYQAMHRYGRARTEYQKDLTIGGHTAEDHESLGDLDLADNRLHDAEEEYRQALASDPVLSGAYVGLGKLDLKSGKPADALKEFTEACKLVPDAPEAHYLRGRALMRLNRRQEAQAEFNASTRLQAQKLQDFRNKMDRRQ